MNTNELNEFFHMAKITTPVSTGEVLTKDAINAVLNKALNKAFEPEQTETQKHQIWLELKLQEEMFKKEKDTIFKTYK